MPPAAVVRSANPDHLASSDFLVNLAVTFNVTSIPLAIFILILVCIACVLFLALLILCIRRCFQRRFAPKVQRRPVKSIYTDEIPGLVHNEQSTKFGTLEYSLEYNLPTETLTVGVVQANNLLIRPEVDMLDPYVSVSLYHKKGEHLSMKGKMNKTAVRKRTNHPNWHQTYDYKVHERDLHATIILLQVFDYDSIGQDWCIGQLTVPLKDVNEADYAGQILEVTGWLEDSEPLVEGVGEICIGLKYDPQYKTLEVTILEARQLTVGDKMSSGKHSRLLVHVHFNTHKKKLGSSETKAKTEVINPYFNEKMTFPVKADNIEDCYLVCSLRTHGGMGRKKTLGFVELGSSSPMSTGVKQWEDMIGSPSRIRVMWHTILVGSHGT